MTSAVTERPVPLSRLSEHAPVALIALAADGTVRDTNPAAEMMLGQSAKGLLGKRLEALIVGSDELLSLLDHARKTCADTASSQLTLKPVGLGEERQVTARVRWFASGELVLALSNTLNREADDSVAGVASFGRILGHEIKNPLAGISGAAQLLMRRAAGADRELLSLIRDEAARIERLVNRLSAFELFSEPRFSPVNIHQILDRIIVGEEAAFDGQLEFLRRYDPSLPEIDGDADHLHEALQNVVRNGVEAAIANTSAKAPRVEIRTSFEARFARRVSNERGALRRALRVDVVDSGRAVDKDTLANVFEAFSSSKSAGRGLGLTIVKEVITAHQGTATIRRSNEGTIASLYLPFKQGLAQKGDRGD